MELSLGGDSFAGPTGVLARARGRASPGRDPSRVCQSRARAAATLSHTPENILTMQMSINKTRQL